MVDVMIDWCYLLRCDGFLNNFYDDVDENDANICDDDDDDDYDDGVDDDDGDGDVDDDGEGDVDDDSDGDVDDYINNTTKRNAKAALTSPVVKQQYHEDNIQCRNDVICVPCVRQVDTNCDGTVDWEEYLTFMLLECRERDLMTTMELKPFPRVARFITSEHRDSIVRIVLVPYMISSQIAAVMNNSKGRYVACGKDGTVTFWSMSMEHKTSQKVILYEGREGETIWVTHFPFWLEQSKKQVW